MQNDLLDQISAINPLPEDLPAPPIASLPPLDRPEPNTEPRRPPRRRSVFLKRGALALPVAAVVLALALLGQGGGSQFDVAAAVYKATIAGNGVHYMYLVGEGQGVTTRFQRWSTTDPFREREVIVTKGRTVELVSGGGIESAWATEHAHKVLRVHGSAPISKWDPVRTIQDAYRAGRLHVVGKTAVGARAAYITKILPLRGNEGTTVIVDAHTFMPVEMIYRRPTDGAQLLVIHVLSYEEMPPTPANLTLIGLAHHPGARVVMVKRPAPHSGR